MTKNDMAFEKREKLSDKFVYKVFDQPFCFLCAYFHFSNTKGNINWRGKNSCGTCALMKRNGAYGGVMSSATCSKFQFNTGTNINGKPVKNMQTKKTQKKRKEVIA